MNILNLYITSGSSLWFILDAPEKKSDLFCGFSFYFTGFLGTYSRYVSQNRTIKIGMI